MSDITLTSTQRNTLQSLSQVTSLNNRTQERLNSGKKVNSVTDDAVAYFRSSALSSRATEFTNRKTDINQSVQSLQAALTATAAVSNLLSTLKGVVDGAKGAPLSNREAATSQFKNIGQQLAQLVKDSTYQGLNILTSSAASLSTQFSERTAATFKVSGYNLTSTAAGNSNALFTAGTIVFSSTGAIVFSNVVGSVSGSSGSVTGFSSIDLTGTQAGQGTVKASTAAAIFANADNTISAAISKLQSVSAALGTNVAILQSRASFSSNYASTLNTGSDNLTLADLNTEAANSQALSLRQQLGIQSLSVSGTQNQSILTLLK